jgi:hypothetical protein
MTANGIYQMLRRRAVQAGYDRSAIWPHLFRHTRAHLHQIGNVAVAASCGALGIGAW